MTCDKGEKKKRKRADTSGIKQKSTCDEKEVKEGEKKKRRLRNYEIKGTNTKAANRMTRKR